MICGYCKMTGVDVAHVKLCKSLTPEKRKSLKGKRFSQPVTRPNNTTATTPGPTSVAPSVGTKCPYCGKPNTLPYHQNKCRLKSSRPTTAVASGPASRRRPSLPFVPQPYLKPRLSNGPIDRCNQCGATLPSGTASLHDCS